MSDVRPRLRVAGLGRYLPSRVVTAAEIDELVGCPPGWASRTTGVEQRRWAGGETTVEMAAAAAVQALADAGLAATDLDLIVNASATAYMTLPDASCFLHRELGLAGSGVAALTVNSTCLSFVSALGLVDALIGVKQVSRVLIVSSEMPSLAINMAQPESAALLGDMAVAAVCVAEDGASGFGLRSWGLETYSEGVELTTLAAGGIFRHPHDPRTTEEDFLFSMNGPEIFRLTRAHMAPFLDRVLPGGSASLADVDIVVPHQASLPAMTLLARSMRVPQEKMVVNAPTVGNCVAASIPGALFDGVRSGRIQPGSQVLLVGTSAGLSLGAALFCW
jgi:3-oxoacyl-[acyl-carrier-protein] synthase-3